MRVSHEMRPGIRNAAFWRGGEGGAKIRWFISEGIAKPVQRTMCYSSSFLAASNRLDCISSCCLIDEVFARIVICGIESTVSSATTKHGVLRVARGGGQIGRVRCVAPGCRLLAGEMDRLCRSMPDSRVGHERPEQVLMQLPRCSCAGLGMIPVGFIIVASGRAAGLEYSGAIPQGFDLAMGQPGR